MQFYQVKDLSGGIDDSYLSVAPNSASILNNLWIDQYGKPQVRPGLNAYVTRAPISGASTTFFGLYVGEEPYGRPVGVRADSVYAISSTNTWVEILGPANNHAVPNKLVTQPEALVIWQKQLVFTGGATVLPGRIYCSAFSGAPNTFTSTYKALTLGMPALASAPTVTVGTPGSNNYIYAFYYDYSLTDYLGTIYEELGAEIGTEVTVASSSDPGTHSNAISIIPALTNSSSTNYDIANIKVKIFRTLNNGTTLYFLGQVNNGTTTFTDSVADSTIQNNAPIYTAGGVLDYNQPPVGSYYVTQVDDFFWYATPQLVTHSIQGNPGACPTLYYQFTEQKILGLNNVISYPILFCDKSVYRIEGNYDEFGNGGFDLREISQTAGCLSNRSIVPIPGGLVWAGNGGFFFTDGTTVLQLSRHIFQRYLNWANTDIVGVFDSVRNLVYWTVSSSASTAYADTIAVMHLNFGVSQRCVFTTWTGTGIFPTTLAYTESQDTDSRFRFKLLCMDYRGYLLSFDDQYFTDPKLNTDVAIASFAKSAIIYRMESAGLDFGQDASRKYCTQLTAEIDAQTDLSMQFWSRRDDEGPWASLSELRYDGAIIWGISEYPWNGPNDNLLHNWNAIPVLDGMRQLPAGTLRSNRRQIALTNSMTWIARSDDWGTATVVSDAPTNTKTVTLDAVGAYWPSDCEDYILTFALDGYQAGWTIKTRVSDTQVIVWDPLGTLVSAIGTKWQLKGYRKFERPHLLSFSLWFDEQGEVTQPPSRGQTAYVNA